MRAYVRISQIYENNKGGKMTYIDLINAFEKWLETNYLPSSAQLLWYKLIALFNKAGWSEWVTVDNYRLMSIMQMESEKTLIRCRDKLIESNFFEYQKGKKGSPNKYKILTVNFTVQTTVNMTVEMGVKTTANVSNINRIRQEKDKDQDINKKEIKKKNETEIDQLINSSFTNEELKNTVYDFIKMRKAIKKPLTTKGLELMIKKLYTLSTDIDEQIQILNNSIMNNWQGIFPIKQECKQKNNKGNLDDFKELWEEAKKQDEQTGNNTNNNTFGW
jgi:hypothetical protein